MKSNPGLKLFHPDKLNLTVKIIGKINMPIKTIKPGSKNTYLCLKFSQ